MGWRTLLQIEMKPVPGTARRAGSAVRYGDFAAPLRFA
jgi:hypothetical protein